MTTKHKPATPLPWRNVDAPERGHYDRAHVVSDHFNRDGIVSGQGSITAGGVCGPDGSRALSTQNAAYIAHAANAYQKLVAALDVLSKPLAKGWKVSDMDERISESRALLRDLGEDA